MTVTYTLHPLGRVSTADGSYELLIDEAARPAMTGLDGFSHVIVTWWCDQLDTPEYRTVTTTPRPYRKGPEQLGVFASRSPVRPNPLAITIAPVVGLDLTAGRISVAYIDAEDGTPIVDVKPYHPAVDRVREVRVPDWCADWPEWYEDSATFDWGAVFENAH